MGTAMKVMKAMKLLKGKFSKSKKVIKDAGNKDHVTPNVMKKPSSNAVESGRDDVSVVSKALTATPSLNAKLAILKASPIPTAEKVKLLNEKLTHPEWNKLNGRFATARINDADLDETASQTPRTMLRTLTTAWVLDPAKGEVFKGISCNISTSHTVTKTLVWESEKTILQKWSQDELDKHLASGRIIWREDPSTQGVYEYKDTKQLSEQQQVQRNKLKDFKQKTEVVEEEFENEMNDLENAWNSTGVDSYSLVSLRGTAPEGKGSETAKGKGKGNGKKGNGKLRIEDDPKKKLKSTKALLTTTTKNLSVWGFNQTKMDAKTKKILQQSIKKLEKQAEQIPKLEGSSSEDIMKFITATMKLIAECKKIMD